MDSNINLLTYIIILSTVVLVAYVVIKNWETLKNISKIEDLRKRILTTVLFIAVYRLGSHILLPGIDADMLINLRRQTSSGLLQLLDMFSGGAFSNASIFALGIMPYISASIVLQLLTIAVPSFQKLQKEGESGRMKINQYTRYLTLVILAIQGPSYLFNLRHQIPGFEPPISWSVYMMMSTVILAAGSSFILWLGERITDKGIGNGVSFIIMIGIIARFPSAFMQELTSRMAGAAGGGLIMFLFEIIALLLVTAATIMLVQGVRKIPVQYARRIEGGRQIGGARQYIPLKVNAANVMPIIFAQAVMFIPIAFIGTSEPTGFAMKLIDTVMSRITWPGALFLTMVAVMPAFARLFGVNQAFAQFFGGTSLIILIGVVLDTLQQVESHLLMRHYDGLLKTGRIKGRAGV
jgi:preprotein translocase subunit SecY